MIKLILIVLIGIIALSYLGISLKGIIESPAGQENIHYVWQLVLQGWDYLVNVIATRLNHA